MSTLSTASPVPAFASCQKLSTIHPLLILPVVGVAAWLAADLLPGSAGTPAQAEAKAADSDPVTPAAQNFADTIPAQMPATLFSAAPASSAAPAAYASLGDGGAGAAAGSSGGGSGSSDASGGQPKQHDHRPSAIDASHHLHAGFARQGFLHPQRPMSPTLRQVMPRPQLQPRIAYAAPVAPRVMPAPRMIYRPVPFGGGFAPRGFGGGGFHFGGGHFGGGRR